MMMIYVAAWLMRCNKSKVEIKGFSAGAGPAVTMRNALVAYSPALLIHHTQLTHPLTVAKSLQTTIGGYSGSLLRFIKDHHGIQEEKWGHVMALQVLDDETIFKGIPREDRKSIITAMRRTLHAQGVTVIGIGGHETVDSKHRLFVTVSTGHDYDIWLFDAKLQHNLLSKCREHQQSGLVSASGFVTMGGRAPQTHTDLIEAFLLSQQGFPIRSIEQALNQGAGGASRLYQWAIARLPAEEGRELTKAVALHSLGLLHPAVRDIFNTRVLPLAFKEMEEANQEQFALASTTVGPQNLLAGEMYLTPAGQGIGDLLFIPGKVDRDGKMLPPEWACFSSEQSSAGHMPEGHVQGAKGKKGAGRKGGKRQEKGGQKGEDRKLQAEG